MLSKKMLRTVGQYKTQFISMAIMIALGTGVFIGFNMEWHSIESNADYAFEETGFSDYRLYDDGGFSESDLAAVSAIDGVDEATRYLSVNTKSTADGDTITLTVTTNENVSGFMVMSGEEYDRTSTDGIWISDRYADANGLEIGDSVSMTYLGYTVTGTIKGLVKSGEYLIYMPEESQVMPDFNTSGFCFISPVMLESALGYTYYNQLNVLSDMSKSDFVAAANEALGRTTLCIPKNETVSYTEAEGEAEEGKTMASILPVLFLAIAVLTMITTMHRITTNERIQIGTLKALGFRNSKIKFHYSLYALFIGIVGTVFGAVIGYVIGWYIINPNGAMSTYIDFPRWDLSLPGYTYVTVILIDVLLVVVGYLSVSKILMGSAADSLRPSVPKKMKSLAIERTGLWNRLGFGTRWNIRDTFRHKARSLMTLIGVLGCVMLLVASFGMRDTMDKFIDTFYEDGINYETVINLSDDATNADAISMNETYEGDWASRTQVLQGDSPLGLDVYCITNDHVRFYNSSLNRVELQDGGAYICQRIAKDTGLGVGDEITFTTYISSITYSVEIIGVLNSISESIVMTSATADSIGMAYDINTIYTDETDIPASSLIKSTTSKQSIIDAFDTFMEIMNLFVFLLVAAAVVLGVIVLYNLGTLSYIERMREMATLKVVGFRDGQIGKILIGQNVWITVVGIVLGIPAGYYILDYLLNALAADYEMSLAISVSTYCIAIFATLAVSLLVGWLIGRNSRKIDMVSSLKGLE